MQMQSHNPIPTSPQPQTSGSVSEEILTTHRIHRSTSASKGHWYHEIEIMHKKHTRYSRGLAEDWVISTHSDVEATTITASSSAIKYPIHPTRALDENPSNIPIEFQPNSRPTNAQPETKRRHRYKKSLPPDWVTSGSDDDLIIGNPLLPPLRRSPGSAPLDFKLHDESLEPRSHHQPAKRLNGPIHISPENRNEVMPTPVPIDIMQMVATFGKLVHEEQRSPVFYYDNAVNGSSRSGQRSYFGLRPSRSFGDARPISVVNSSSTRTSHSSYGCDVPARPPSMSSNYSNY